MPRQNTPSFVIEIPLKVTANQERILLKRFEVARQVYNACLGECLKRYDLLRQSKAWQKARKQPRGKPGSEGAKARMEAFREAKNLVGFSKYSIINYKTQFSSTWLNYHVDSKVAARMAVRAFDAVQQYSFGRRGRPRFKRKGEINSVEGETNASPLRWREDKVIWNTDGGKQKMELPAMLDPDSSVQAHGLSCRVKYVRLVKPVINGRNRFYAQLVNEGLPYVRVEVGQGVVGLDIGPSTVAAVSEDEAFLVQFCAELENRQKEIARLQRKIDRQRRINNPDNYETDWWEKKSGGKNWVHKKGKVKKGPKIWEKSNRQNRNEAKLAELRRKQASHRKSLHGRLVNRILGMGDVIKLEKLSYKAFQRMSGKSVGMRAPGEFVARLRQKSQAGLIDVDEFSAYATRLSQLDHKTGAYRKKPRSQGWHYFEDGEVAQRDLYSAFLATCVEDDTFNAVLAKERWTGGGHTLAGGIG
ncbi:MAG: helix-turn-helix domain-containing protein [Planctomycetota bacterium]|jgi:hypothetical protein